MTDTCNKITALSTFVGCEKDEIQQSAYNENVFEIDSDEYLVCTDDESDSACAEYIKETLWAFNPSFLSGETGLPEEMFIALQPLCEGANDAIEQVITDFDGFVQSAVSADGRGHFLSGYDGEESEQDGFFIYRIN